MSATCTWVAWCNEPAGHDAEHTTRPGLTVREVVCDEHRDHAVRQGYRVTENPDPEAPA